MRVRIQTVPLLLVFLAAGVFCPEARGARFRQEASRTERTEYETADGAAGVRRLITREETGNRRVETWVVERASINGGFEVLLEVEEETVQVDETSTRTTRREFGTDADGRRTLVAVIQEESHRRPDGSGTLVREVTSPDGNGREQLTRRETENTTSSPDGTFRTDIEVATPGINSNGLVTTGRTVETGRRDSEDRLVESDRTVYSDTTGRGNWIPVERRMTTQSFQGQTTETIEHVYRQDGGGDLVLDEQIVRRETNEPGGSQRITEDVYSTDIPGQRSVSQPELLRQTETVRVETSGGGWETTRQVRESRQNRVRVVEREIERARPRPDGGFEIEHEIQRLDANGRLRTVSATTASESGF